MNTQTVILITVLCTVVTTVATVYATVLRPARKAREEAERQRAALSQELERKRRVQEAFIEGQPAIAGIQPALEPAAARLYKLEGDVGKMKFTLDSLDGYVRLHLPDGSAA